MKFAETPITKVSPAVSTLPHKMKRAGSGTCLCGVECFTLAWISGLLTAFLSDFRILILLLAVGIFVMLRLTGKERLLLILGAILGAVVWMRYDLTVRQPLFALDGKQVQCTGVITNTQTLPQERAVYTLRTTLNRHPISIDWYADAEIQPLQIGEIVTLEAELTRIQPDYRYHTAQYQAGLGKYLRIYDATLTDHQPDSGFSLARILHQYRQRITKQIRSAISSENAGLLCAMLFGDKLMLSEDTAAAFRAAGIGHITVVSGLHLIFFCSALASIFRRLQFPEIWICLLHIPAILLFIMLAAPSISEARAAIMLMLSQSAALFGRKSDTLRSLCIAMFLCTVFTPYVIGSVSFWLSVSGVFGIGVLAPYMTKNMQSGLKKDFLSLVCVSAAIFPASILLCGQSSLLAPICNLLILPLCVAVIYFGFSLLLTGGLTGFLLPVIGLLCSLIRSAANFAAHLPFSHIAIRSNILLFIIILSSLFLLYLMFAGIPPKHLAAALLGTAIMISALNLSLQIQARNELRIAILGGNQQAVAVISAEGQTILADLTDAPNNAQYAAQYLKQNGITKVNALILNGTRAAASYQASLHDIKPDHIILRHSKPWREDSRLFGEAPAFYDSEPIVLSDGAFSLTLADNTADLQWGTQHISICSASGVPTPEANAVIRYGSTHECEITINGKIYRDSNLLLRIISDGGSRVSPA